MKVYDGTTSETASSGTPERVKVGIAEYEVADGNAVLTTSGLGSCLGVALHDRATGLSGLVHVMLPSRDDDDESSPAKFADSGIETLVREMRDRGADTETLEAKIAGGSDMLDFSENGSGIGVRNVETGRETLASYGIPIVGEDVGGEHGRSLRMESDTGDLVVKSANRDSITL